MPILSIPIPDDNAEDLKAGFLAAKPNKGEGTDLEWIVECIKEEYIFPTYKRGKKRIAKQTAEINDNILE